MRVDPATDLALARSLLDLQHAAYRVEAALFGHEGIPAWHETLPALRASGLEWRALLDGDGALRAAIGIRWRDGVVDVDRLVVRPDQARRGLGSALLASVLADADDAGLPVVVSTGRGNEPGRRFYEHFGFTWADDEPVTGLVVSSFRWTARRAVRVLCRDSEGAVLLLHWRDPVGGAPVSEPPGGGVEPGEDLVTAARRELHEETGLVVGDLHGPLRIARDYTWNGRRYVGSEDFLLAQLEIAAPEVEPAALTAVERSAWKGHSWVRPDDLPADVQPPGLAEVLERLRR